MADTAKQAADAAAAAFLASLGAPAVDASKAKKTKRKGKKKTGGKGDESDDDAPVVSGGGGETAAAVAGEGTPAPVLPSGGSTDATPSAGGAGDDAGSVDGEGGAGDGGDKGKGKGKGKGKDKEKGKKPTAAAKLALERQERMRLEAERAAKEEEERRKAEEEEARKLKEAEDARLAKIAAKKERERLKIEQQKKDGTYRTPAQRAKEAANRAKLEQMVKAGLLPASALESGSTDAADEGEKPKKKVVYGKPKKKAAGAGGADESSSGGNKQPAGGDGAGGGAGGINWDDDDDEALAAAVSEKLGVPASDDTEESPDAEGTPAAASSAEDSPVPSGGGSATAPSPLATASTASSSVPPSVSGGAGGGGGGGGSRKPLEVRIEESRKRRLEREAKAYEERSVERLRSPICCVLGHVDTGKTKLLDKIRRTNVQEGEAGGITQQIGATYFPMERIRAQTDKVNKDLKLEYRVPGLLMIDTPGHESFTNLRTRGSSLCDIAVLVVDLMHGLEPQTIESLNMLRKRKTPFVVALNKVDRVYGWKAKAGSPIQASLGQQEEYAISEFEDRTKRVLLQLAEQGLNAKLYYENDDFRRVVSVVPTSAHTGEGIPDLLMLLVQLTQQLMSKKIMFANVVECTVLEVKTVEGLGTTVDVILVNGALSRGDTIVLCGMNGPIVTQIRALLTPQPLRELRVKGDFVHHDRIEAAMGLKISAHYMEKAIAGTQLFVVHPEDEVEELKQEVMKDFDNVMASFPKQSRGVFVQASTLGSLEALLEYLRTHDPPVPVAGVNLGPIHKRDVVQASAMLEHKPEYATILAFDVKVAHDAQAYAEEVGVRIFTANIIYHLTDQFEKFMDEAHKAAQEASQAEAVFPCICKIIPTAVFNAKNPIVLGMDVLEGSLRIGTPLCVVRDAATDSKASEGAAASSDASRVLVLGRVTSMERNHEAVTVAKPGGPSVAVKIEGNEEQQSITVGRHFDVSMPLYSKISRASIDLLKQNFMEEMTQPDWKLVIKLKSIFGVK